MQFCKPIVSCPWQFSVMGTQMSVDGTPSQHGSRPSVSVSVPALGSGSRSLQPSDVITQIWSCLHNIPLMPPHCVQGSVSFPPVGTLVSDAPRVFSVSEAVVPDFGMARRADEKERDDGIGRRVYRTETILPKRCG